MEEFVMEEKLMGFSNKDATHVVKRKRTKRLRLLSPCGVVSTVSSCSSGESNTDLEDDEEDMANCLILLAQGGNHKQHGGAGEDEDGDHDNKREKGSNGNKKIDEVVTATKGGLYIYECKTCNRTFPSFQALGGHRASHKKPKLMAEVKKPPPSPLSQSQPQTSSQDSPRVKLLVAKCDEFEVVAEKPRGPTISFHMGNQSSRGVNGNKAKIHECSICGSEFSSGQALGGHMRRHRTSSANTAAVAVVDGGVRPPRNILQLDLNLPAPEEDIREAKFQFPTQKSMVMSATPALVDCHY
ncbi:zinc finger protein ZAT5-like [Vicia villosa]|uniref:zinc finger protein ZAT5-like n=1 Tax=Vicia villosa TaxID=3911 RepID=UPI00273B2C2C|nr:zinc finger protein ZAT5-like [Vicia villosa]